MIKRSRSVRGRKKPLQHESLSNVSRKICGKARIIQTYVRCEIAATSRRNGVWITRGVSPCCSACDIARVSAARVLYRKARAHLRHRDLGRNPPDSGVDCRSRASKMRSAHSSRVATSAAKKRSRAQICPVGNATPSVWARHVRNGRRGGCCVRKVARRLCWRSPGVLATKDSRRFFC